MRTLIAFLFLCVSVVGCGGGGGGGSQGASGSPAKPTFGVLPKLSPFEVQIVWSPGNQVFDSFELECQFPGTDFQRIDPGTLGSNSVAFDYSLTGKVEELQDITFRIWGVKGGARNQFVQPAAYHVALRTPPVDFHVGGEGFVLNFDLSSSKAEGCIVQRLGDDGSFVEFSPLYAASGLKLVDDTVVEGRSYLYNFRAFKGSEVSTSGGRGPIQWWNFGVRNLSITLTGLTAKLDWDTKAVHTDEITIYRQTGLADGAGWGFPPVIASLPADARSFTDTLPSPGPYSYKVSFRRGSTENPGDAKFLLAAGTVPASTFEVILPGGNLLGFGRDGQGRNVCLAKNSKGLQFIRTDGQGRHAFPLPTPTPFTVSYHQPGELVRSSDGSLHAVVLVNLTLTHVWLDEGGAHQESVYTFPPLPLGASYASPVGQSFLLLDDQGKFHFVYLEYSNSAPRIRRFEQSGGTWVPGPQNDIQGYNPFKSATITHDGVLALAVGDFLYLAAPGQPFTVAPNSYFVSLDSSYKTQALVVSPSNELKVIRGGSQGAPTWTLSSRTYLPDGFSAPINLVSGSDYSIFETTTFSAQKVLTIVRSGLGEGNPLLTTLVDIPWSGPVRSFGLPFLQPPYNHGLDADGTPWISFKTGTMGTYMDPEDTMVVLTFPK